MDNNAKHKQEGSNQATLKANHIGKQQQKQVQLMAIN
jgi:hypothetical protein